MFASSSGASTSSRTQNGRRLDHEDRENQRNRGQRLLAAGKQADIDDLLAGRLGQDVDAGFEDIGRAFRVNQREVCLTAAEDDRKESFKAISDRFESLLEAFFGSLVDVLDRVLEVLDRVLEVVFLGQKVIVALLELFILLDRHDVDFAQAADPFAEALDFLAEKLLFFGGHLGRHDRLVHLFLDGRGDRILQAARAVLFFEVLDQVGEISEESFSISSASWLASEVLSSPRLVQVLDPLERGVGFGAGLLDAILDLGEFVLRRRARRSVDPRSFPAFRFRRPKTPRVRARRARECG